MLAVLVTLLVALNTGAVVASQQETPWPPAGVVRTGPGITAPRLVKDEKPKYTAAAMQEKIAGTVLMDVVVNADGNVGEVRVTKSLDREYGLDDQAIAAVKNWKFKPGMKDGAAVPVLVEIEMTFTLRK